MRYNYASMECGARIVGQSKEVSGASGVLSANRDAYLVCKCSQAERFIIVELCQEVRVDELACSNFEYFSSTFRRIRLSVAKKHQPEVGGDDGGGGGAGDKEHGWSVLGEWEAEPGRGEQRFRVSTRPSTQFTRFVRIDFVGRHGSAYYCPVTSVKVFGKTMMEEYVEDSYVEDSHVKDSYVENSAHPSALPLPPPPFIPTIYNHRLARLIGPPSATCCSAHPETSTSGSDNVFKAIHDRVCQLERANVDHGKLGVKVEGLARLVVDLAVQVGQLDRVVVHKADTADASAGQPGCVARAELYLALGVSSMLFLLVVHCFSPRRAPRRANHCGHQRANTDPAGGTAFAATEAIPLDAPNSDYLGLLRTPVDSPHSPTSPVRRRAGSNHK